jgi:hypothetical protein
MLERPIATRVAIGATILMTTALTAYAGGHGGKTIGQTTALIPEAGLPTSALADGESGNTNFPFADFKALATVGEVDAETGMALTGYPDGQAAWLADENAVRVVYQSESYATMGSAPQPETYPWKMANGVTFTGSHIHTIDYDRAAFAEFMGNDAAAATMVKGSGKLFDIVYNAFGEVVAKPSYDPSDLAGKWGNQTRPDGTLIQFSPGFPSEHSRLLLSELLWRVVRAGQQIWRRHRLCRRHLAGGRRMGNWTYVPGRRRRRGCDNGPCSLSR